MGTTTSDIIWVLISAILVFMMQAGFLALETGLTRSKNNINVAIKNIIDFCLSTGLFWMVGFGIMFGPSAFGVLGNGRFLFEPSASDLALSAFFIYQAMFAGTAITIVSGAVAERLRFRSYVMITLAVALLIYPLFGHWAWNGLELDMFGGWLGRLRFRDFAGGTVVHGVGGWAALAILLVIGPRNGRFDADGHARPIPGANIPVAALGVLFLYVGWIGFNGGSSLAFDHSVLAIVANTLIAGAFGLISTLIISWFLHGTPRYDHLFNGCLAGLVAITAGADVVTLSSAALIGFVGGCVMLLMDDLLLRWQIDDAISAVPVHLGSGVWGTMAVALLGRPEALATGLAWGEQLLVQFLGIVVCGLWTFGVVSLLFRFINRIYPLRVLPEDEKIGLNISEHGASTEAVEFLNILHEQSQTGDLRLRVPVEPFTEIGQIARQYNRVMNRLEQAVDQAQAVVSQAMDGIIAFTLRDLRIVLFNPAAELIFEAPSSQVVGLSLANLLKSDHVALGAIFKDVVGKQRPFELTGQTIYGRQFPVEVTLAQTRLNDRGIYIGTFRDITERTQVREKLLELNAELLQTTEAKDHFLATMSHELRTPLNIILANTQALQADIYGELTDLQRKPVDRVEQGGEHLLALVTDILDISKMRSGQFELSLTAVSIPKLIEETKYFVQQIATQKKIEINSAITSDVTVIQADERRLKQILLNLLSNAVKFTSRGRQIGIEVATDATQDTIDFIVWDQGIGISKQDQKRLFQPFTQADGKLAREYEGTGLGLALVKQLAELHGGFVSLQSEVGIGSRFTVSLPKHFSDSVTLVEKLDATTDTIANTKRTQAQPKPLVLVVEDNESNLVITLDILHFKGYQTAVARDGIEALEAVEASKPDIVLMDIQMPRMDGIDATAKIREQYSADELPIIALTGLALSGDKERILESGANEFLTKPLRIKILTEALEKFHD